MTEAKTAEDRPKSLVLVVDDQRVNRMLIGAVLDKMGLSAVFAENGVEAVESFKENRPDLVVMDIYMPEMDGIEATRQIKALTENDFVPIMVVSGAEAGEVVQQVVDAGADDFIQRPFSTELLQAKTVAALRNREVYRQLMVMNKVRQREEEIAEQLFSNAVESRNVTLPGVYLHKSPAETFSGDVVLSARRPNGDIYFLLGDFTGHGLTTTIGALPLSETFNSMTKKGFDAEEILGQINAKLYRLLPRGMFLAAGMACLSVNDNTISLWNGGLPDLKILKADGDHVNVASSHIPLAILEQVSDIRFQVFSLSADDRVLLLSDGVGEALASSGERFEDHNLDRIFDNYMPDQQSVSEIIIKELDLFCHGIAQSDDISIIELPGQIPQEKLQRSAQPAEINDNQNIDTDYTNSDDVWSWHCELEGRSISRINPVALAMARLQESEGEGEHWQSVFSVLTELYVNALDHGVLGLDSAMKSSAEGFVRYFQEREDRLSKLTDGTISFYIKHSRLEHGGFVFIRIQDSGAGFDYKHWLEQADQQGDDTMLSGRGIRLIKQLTEQFKYSDSGRCVEAGYRYVEGQA